MLVEWGQAKSFQRREMGLGISPDSTEPHGIEPGEE